MEILYNGKVYKRGEVIKPEEEAADPVVLQVNGLPPVRVSRSELAKNMREIGFDKTQNEIQKEQHLTRYQGDTLASLKTVVDTLTDHGKSKDKLNR